MDRSDAEYSIVGSPVDGEGWTRRLVRKAPDLDVRRVLGERDGWVSIADHWQEVHDGPDTLCLTVVHSPYPGEDGQYGAIVWYRDALIAGALRALNLRDALAVTVYAVGALGLSIRKPEQARAAGLALARLVTNGALPWPPEDEKDHAVWAAVTAAVDQQSGR